MKTIDNFVSKKNINYNINLEQDFITITQPENWENQITLKDIKILFKVLK